MSHPVRKWLKDLLQYGRRTEHNPADGRPPLLWVADLPRLGRMWLGHYWFRTWLDLRSTPPRVIYQPRELFSPHVRSIRPTQFHPIRPIRQSHQMAAKAYRWFAQGGMRRAASVVAALFAGGFVRGIGLLFFGFVGLLGAGVAAIAGLIGVSALGTIFRLSAARRIVGRAIQWGSGSLANVAAGTMERSRRMASGLRSPRELAWTFATLAGTVGLILLLVLHVIGVPVASPNLASAADRHVAHRPPMVVAQSEPAEDPFGGLPDPFGPSSAEEPDVPADFGDDPFGPFPGEEPEPQSEPEPVPEQQPEPDPVHDLEFEVVRSSPPEGIARFNLPDDDEQFVVTSTAENVELPDANAFPPDDWLRAVVQDEVARPPVVPAAYRELVEQSHLDEPVVQPSDSADESVPPHREVGIGIRKTLPANARSGELIWYELIVTNHSDEFVEDVYVDEVVEEPHRIADARPAADFADGVLSWRLDMLRPGEERRLSVAVFPMSEAPITTRAAVRTAATVSATTIVESREDRPKPLTDSPEPVEQPESVAPAEQPVPTREPQPALVRRIMIEMTVPTQTASDAECVIRFAVTNTGTEPLSGVVIQAVLPERLAHQHGDVVEAVLGDLAPAETKHGELHVIAGSPGETEILAQVAADEGVATTVQGSLEIIESQAVNFGPPCCQPLARAPVTVPVR